MGLARLQPCFVLALRIVLGYAVSVLDYQALGQPLPPAKVTLVQRAVDGVLTGSLRVPRGAPRTLLP